MSNFTRFGQSYLLFYSWIIVIWEATWRPISIPGFASNFSKVLGVMRLPQVGSPWADDTVASKTPASDVKKTLKTHHMFSQILTVCKEFRILSDEISVGHYGFQLICTEAELPVSLWRTIGINWLWWTFASSLSSNKLWHYQFDWRMVASQRTRISFASDILQVVSRAKFVVQWKVVR